MLASEMDDQTFLFDVDDFEGARVTMQVSGQTYLNTFALDPRNVHRDILALAADVRPAGRGVLAEAARAVRDATEAWWVLRGVMAVEIAWVWGV